MAVFVNISLYQLGWFACVFGMATGHPWLGMVLALGLIACDLDRFLTSLDTKPKGAGKIGWNFEKSTVNPSGEVVAHFESSTKPDASEVVEIIDRKFAKAAGTDREAGTEQPSSLLRLRRAILGAVRA